MFFPIYWPDAIWLIVELQKDSQKVFNIVYFLLSSFNLWGQYKSWTKVKCPTHFDPTDLYITEVLIDTDLLEQDLEKNINVTTEDSVK